MEVGYIKIKQFGQLKYDKVFLLNDMNDNFQYQFTNKVLYDKKRMTKIL